MNNLGVLLKDSDRDQPGTDMSRPVTQDATNNLALLLKD